jgi:hypothetical protein
MWRILGKFIDRIMIAFVLAAWAAMFGWIAIEILPNLMSTRSEGFAIEVFGSQLGLVIACAVPPVLIASFYSVWIVIKGSAEAREMLRRRLASGWYSRLDNRQRLMSVIDRLVLASRLREESHRAAKAAILSLPEWRWIVKPMLIGLIPVIVLSPIVFTLVLISSSMTLRGTLIGLGWTWVAATSAYWIARWTGFLDDRDRLPSQRKLTRKPSNADSSANSQRQPEPALGHVTGQSSAWIASNKDEARIAASSNMGADNVAELGTSAVRVVPVPYGFRWVEFGNAFFFQPESWHVVALEARPVRDGIATDVYATSPARFSREEPFETGFTLHVMSGMKSGYWPGGDRVYRDYILHFEIRIEDGDRLIEDDHTENGLRVVTLRYRDREPGRTNEIVHKCIAIDEALEMVWAFTFECPESEWEAYWRTYGTHMIHRISIKKGASIDFAIH